MRCPKCNNEVPEGKQFCGHCGHRLAPVEPAPPAGFDEEALTKIVPPKPEEPPPEPEAEAEPTPPPPVPEPEPPPEVEAAPAVEEPAPEEVEEPQPPAVVDRSWLFAWLSTLGWAIGFALLSPIDARIYAAVYQSGAELDRFARAAFVWSITGIIGGLFTGIGLHRAVPGVKRWHVFLIALGWAASLVLSWPTGRQGGMELAYWALWGSILGLVAGLISHRRGASPWWREVLKVLGFVAGTGVAWVLAEVILDETLWSAIELHRVPFLYLAEPVSLIVGGGTGGFLTGLVWRRAAPSVRGKQVLIVSVGWAMGLLLGILIALVDALTLAQQFRSGFDYTVIGVIGGAVGCGVMARQLRRVQSEA